MWDYHKHFSNYAIDIKLAEFDATVEEIRNSSNIRMVDSIDRFKDMNIIFEGSQGLLLDQHIGFFPNVTRSNTGTKNVLKIVDDIDEIFLVTRAYQTRHGNGPMTNWFISENYDIQNIHEVNVNNEYQGEFKTAILDLDLLKYAIDKDEYIYNNKHKCKLMITCLDNIKGDFKFTVNGEVHSFSDQLEFVVEIADELGIDKVYISSSPFSENIHKIC
jgi:adenylosuccinate synthase